jgi:hypothetical protein
MARHRAGQGPRLDGDVDHERVDITSSDDAMSGRAQSKCRATYPQPVEPNELTARFREL